MNIGSFCVSRGFTISFQSVVSSDDLLIKVQIDCTRATYSSKKIGETLPVEIGLIHAAFPV